MVRTRGGAARQDSDVDLLVVEDEECRVIQRRLLERMPEEAVVAAFQQVFTQARKAYAAAKPMNNGPRRKASRCATGSSRPTRFIRRRLT